MRKKILFMIVLLCTGTLAYYGGYHLYRLTHPKVEIVEPESYSRSVPVAEKTIQISRDYYIGIIQGDKLMIYQMPEEIIYDSVELASLKFYDDELQQLTEGMVFQNLKELFEFLENSMS